MKRAEGDRKLRAFGAFFYLEFRLSVRSPFLSLSLVCLWPRDAISFTLSSYYHHLFFFRLSRVYTKSFFNGFIKSGKFSPLLLFIVDLISL